MVRLTGALIAAAALWGCAPVPAATAPGPAPTLEAADATFQAEVVAELNAARTDPAAYAGKMRIMRAWFNGDRLERPGEVPILTREGVAAVDEAIAFLERQTPLPAVARSSGLDRAAAAHAADQARTGAVGHDGGDGSTPAARMRREGWWNATGEAIAYGPDRPDYVILQLIIDDGVADRGHRRILFNPVYSLVGVGCGPHPVWRQVCVLDFARPG